MEGDDRPEPIDMLTAATSLVSLLVALHELGYEQLRMVPGMSATGLFWRSSITSASNLDHRGDLRRYDREKQYFYTSGMGALPHDAERFLEDFPEIAAAGRGPDPSYASWTRQLLQRCREGFVPITYADWPMREDVVTLMSMVRGLEDDAFPLPPAPPAG